MREPIEYLGRTQPMILHTIDMVKDLADHILVLVGFDGSAVSDLVATHCADQKVRCDCVRVSQDDASDKEPCTAGDLKRVAGTIVDGLEGRQSILICVGDQPMMQPETIRGFLERYVKTNVDASILAADVRSTPMEKSTSTRISEVGGQLFSTRRQRKVHLKGTVHSSTSVFS